MGNLRRKFGARLRTLRIQKSLTQEALAEKTGISVEFVSNIERGINAPSFDTLEKLSNSLGIPVVELFEFRE